MIQILVVDDDVKLTQSVCTYLNDSGYEAKGCLSAETAYEAMYNKRYDLIISDIMMPGTDGFEFAKTVRGLNKTIPILFMSARDDLPSKKKGFDLGIDDYMVKPFSPKELMARIKVILKRHQGAELALQEKEVFGGLEIDFAGHAVYVDGKKASLTPKEYDLLTYLVRNKNIAKSREKLLSDVWGFDFYGDDRTVDTHIKMLRANLGPYRDYIVTIRSIGYKFEDKSQKTQES